MPIEQLLDALEPGPWGYALAVGVLLLVLALRVAATFLFENPDLPAEEAAAAAERSGIEAWLGGVFLLVGVPTIAWVVGFLLG